MLPWAHYQQVSIGNSIEVGARRLVVWAKANAVKAYMKEVLSHERILQRFLAGAYEG